MGMNVEAILAYGYDLGTLEDFRAAERSEYGSPELPWYGEAEADQDDVDFTGLAENLLLDAAGFTELDYRADGYFDRKRAAEAQVGVGFDFAGGHDYPGFVLAAKGSKRSVDWAETMTLDPAELAQPQPEWDAKLAAALQTLGITPTQESPRWLVFPFYG